MAGSSSVEAGAEWILEHDNDADIDEAIPLVRRSAEATATPSAAVVESAASGEPAMPSPPEVAAASEGRSPPMPPLADEIVPNPPPLVLAEEASEEKDATVVQVVDDKNGSKDEDGEEDDDDEDEEKLPPVDEALLEEIMALGFPEVEDTRNTVSFSEICENVIVVTRLACRLSVLLYLPSMMVGRCGRGRH